jgi:hypothetical protein
VRRYAPTDKPQALTKDIEAALGKRMGRAPQ